MIENKKSFKKLHQFKKFGSRRILSKLLENFFNGHIFGVFNDVLIFLHGL